jgi:hypothetical protein
LTAVTHEGFEPLFRREFAPMVPALTVVTDGLHWKPSRYPWTHTGDPSSASLGPNDAVVAPRCAVAVAVLFVVLTAGHSVLVAGGGALGRFLSEAAGPLDDLADGEPMYEEHLRLAADFVRRHKPAMTTTPRSPLIAWCKGTTERWAGG